MRDRGDVRYLPGFGLPECVMMPFTETRNPGGRAVSLGGSRALLGHVETEGKPPGRQEVHGCHSSILCLTFAGGGAEQGVVYLHTALRHPVLDASGERDRQKQRSY